MKRIILHWTAGAYYPNATDYLHYHYLVTKEGLIVKGKYTPEDNLNCNDGKYAKHCGGGNTSSIGVAMCGMLGFKNKNSVGNYPLTRIQTEACFDLVAKLAKKYNIEITSSTIMTHYEFGQKHLSTTSFGKIDIIYLPPYPKETKDTVGSFIRGKIKWYRDYA